jgi:hypothetical protein
VEGVFVAAAGTAGAGDVDPDSADFVVPDDESDEVEDDSVVAAAVDAFDFPPRLSVL